MKNGSEDFVTPMHIYGDQYPCGDFWISIPDSTKGKHKILLTIKALLKLDMTIKSISKEERKEKKLKELRQKIDELLNSIALVISQDNPIKNEETDEIKEECLKRVRALTDKVEMYHDIKYI